MTMNMNEIVTVVGNVGGAPDQRQTPSGPVTSFRLGSSHRKFDKQKGEWVDDYTNWFSVNVWRALGEHAYASLHRGERVIVTGRLRAREWETDTKRGVTLEIDAVAVGHDLLWGTTTFTRRAASAGGPAAGMTAETDAARAGSADEAPAVTAGDWGAPAGEPDTWATATVPQGSPEPVDVPF